MEKESLIDHKILAANTNIAARNYWKNRLQGFTLSSYFSEVNQPVAVVENSTGTFSSTAPAEVYESLNSIAASGKAKHIVLLSTLGVLAGKYSQLNDVAIITAAYLDDNMRDLAGNNLLVRMSGFEEKQFPALLTSVKNDVVKDMTFADFPLEKKLNTGEEQLKELSFTGMLLEEAQDPISLDAIDTDLLFSFSARDALRVQIKYNATKFTVEFIEQLARHYYHLLFNCIALRNSPIGDIDFLPSNEKDLFINRHNDTATVFGEEETVIGLFDRQVSEHPHQEAVRCGEMQISYQLLQKSSGSMAGWLQQVHGIGTGHRIGILVNRDEHLVPLIWAILKTGAAYVPIDPSYPADRIVTLVKDAGLKLLIRGNDCAQIEVTGVPQAVVGDMVQSDYRYNPVQVAGTDLAYIVYTSGSTGSPKGVMIEHRSLLNYIRWAAGYYLQKNEPAVFALFTSISFDLTITSIFTPLVSGNSIIVYGEEEKGGLLTKVFTDNIATVIKLTPTHLKILRDSEVDLSAGTHHKKLIVGGEDLERSLAFFIKSSSRHSIRIFNEYGPTEATVGCMIWEYDEKDMESSVPIGVPISNLRIYILDQWLKPVPAGMEGELYISGTGVASGYLYNEVMTTERFIEDPFVPGNRMYKTGDLAVFTTAGKMLFRGRIDEQVKIRGYRIEPGEISSQLTNHENIREAVVVAWEHEGEKYLAAYYTSEQEITPESLKQFLSEKLPAWMVPAYYIHLVKLPVTSNGKLDKKALPDPLSAAVNKYTAPANEIEETLLEIWQTVLGNKKIGVTDNFFHSGGDSIRSIQISARMRRAGYKVSVNDIFTSKHIRELSAKVSPLNTVSDQAITIGTAPLTPIQKWFFEGPIKKKHHYNHSLILNFPRGIDADAVNKIFTKLQEHHDALRIVFKEENGEIIQEFKSSDLPVALTEHDLRNEQQPESKLGEIANSIQSGIGLANGPLMKLGLFHLPGETLLLVVIHHLVTDGISWRIIFEDIDTLYRQLSGNEPLLLPLKTDSWQLWSNQLKVYAAGKRHQQAMKYWDTAIDMTIDAIPKDNTNGANQVSNCNHISFDLSAQDTKRLMTKALTRFNNQVNDLLLTSLLEAVRKKYGREKISIDLESHGREDIAEGIDVSRTVGWFTCIYPVLLHAGNSLPLTIKRVKETLRKVPANGIDFQLHHKPQSAICFNYLGQFDEDLANRSYYLHAGPRGNETDAQENRVYEWDISAMVRQGSLNITFTYSKEQFAVQTITDFLALLRESLFEIIECCCSQDRKELTPSDLTWKELSIEQLDRLSHRYEIQDIYALSPTQSGMLFLALRDPDSDSYFEQMTCHIHGTLDIDAVEKSLDYLTARYDILRTVYLDEGYERPLQVVLKQRKTKFQFIDVRNECETAGKAATIKHYQDKDRRQKFSLRDDVLMRLLVLHTGHQEYVFIWSHHHIIMDGWCMSVIISDFKEVYSKLSKGEPVILPEAKPYAQYIQWLEKRDMGQSVAYWKDYLQYYDSLAGLPQKDFVLPSSPFKAASHLVVIDAAQTTLLRQLSQTCGVSIHTIMQAAWGILLARYNRVNDVVFGSVVSGRPAEIPGIETMVGLFINTIPVRIQYKEDDRVTELLEAVQKSALESEPYHYHPLPEIQSESAAGINLLDHIMIFENYPLADEIKEDDSSAFSDAAYNISDVNMFEQTNYDFAVRVIPRDVIYIRFDYNGSVYESAMLERVAQHWINILEQLAGNKDLSLGDIDLLSAAEKRQVADFNNTAAAYPKDETVVSIFEKQAEETPGNIAVRVGEKTISYFELHKQSQKIAAYLSDFFQAGPGDLVGVMLNREEWLLASLFGILKTGAAYVPIDPGYPAERIHAIVSNAGLKAIITRNRFMQKLRYDTEGCIDLDIALSQIEAMPDTGFTNKARGNELAYVIYTSGTTGRPKGVMIKHHSVINRLLWMQKNYPLTHTDVVLQKTPITFDVSVWELFWWIFGGASLVLAEPGSEKDSDAILEAIHRHQVTAIHFVPSVLGLFLSGLNGEADFTGLQSLRQVFASGEALKPEHVAAFGNTLHRYTGSRLINLYGPTEATVEVSYFECAFEKEHEIIPIGKPIDNISLYILDNAGHVCPVGITGELCIAGAGLAQGYLGNEQLTRQKFIHNFHLSGERLYRTGDLARWLPDGNVEFIGRTDKQIKLRGNRIEPGEIEYTLQQFSQVRDVVVDSRGEGLSKALVAWYVSDNEIEEALLRQYISSKLPEYMIPSWFVHLDKLPVTSNGKLNRKALPDPLIRRAGNFIAPSTILEETLAEIWSEVLKIDKDLVSVDSNFFELGGHSLRSMTLLRKIATRLNVKLSIKEIFNNPTIAGQAICIKKAKKSEKLVVRKAAKKDHYVLSESQKRLYFLYEFDKSSYVYNQPRIVRMQGELNKEKLSKAFRQLVARHEVLRTSFHVINDEPVQVIEEEVNFEVEYISAALKDVRGLMEKLMRPFDLTKAPLFRVTLIEADQNDHFLLVDSHHIIMDGTSTSVLAKEFTILYNDGELPALDFQYKDYAEWKQSPEVVERLEMQKEFWQNEFADGFPVLHLPTDFSRPAIKSHEGAAIDFFIEKELTRQIKDITDNQGVTLYMFLMAVFNVLLAKLSGQDDIVIGSPMAAREHADFEDVIGMFVFAHPIRNKLDHRAPFSRFLQQVKDKTLSCFDNQSYQFETFDYTRNKEHDTSRSQLFDVLFIVQNYESFDVNLSGLSFTPFTREGRESKFDLSLTAADLGERLLFNLEYSTRLFKKETIDRFIEYFRNIISVVCGDLHIAPAAIDMMPENERQQVLNKFNGKLSVVPADITIVGLFEEQVRRSGQAQALVTGDQFLTYDQLNEKANQLCWYLLENSKIGRHDVIGIYFNRSFEMVIAILAIMKSGAPWVAFDPTWPMTRIKHIATDAGVEYVLTNIETGHPNFIHLRRNEFIINDYPVVNPAPAAVGADPAYIIYTSGSTGVPKGIIIEHGAVLDYALTFKEYFQVIGADKVIQQSALTFDTMIEEIFPALISGGSVIILPEGALDIDYMIESLSRHSATILSTTPLVLNELNQHVAKIRNLRAIISGGDVLYPSFVYNLVNKFNVYNTYGPSESTVCISYHKIATANDARIIGKPIRNRQVLILDSHQSLCPVLVKGEICVSGPGLARGYINNAELSAERFIQNPYNPEERLYRTGDLGRWLPDGNIEFLNRADNQVKIRGFRVEPGEIEQVLLQHEAVSQAIVMAKGSGPGKYLVAYFVAEKEISSTHIKNFLSSRLPVYMVPSNCIPLLNMPLTVNGKIDRSALPDPEIFEDNEFTGPSNDMEIMLTEIWAEVLELEKSKVSVNSSFFELGGNSFKILRLHARVNRSLATQVTVPELFRYPTVASLAHYMQFGEESQETYKEELKQDLHEMHHLINLVDNNGDHA